MIKAALYGRCTELGNPEDLKSLLVKLDKSVGRLCIYEPFLEYLKSVVDFDYSRCETFSSEIIPDVDYIVSAGGDGTFLEAARFAVMSDAPILGVNFGRMGFLSQLYSSEIEKEPDELFKNNFETERRSLLSAYIDEKPIALPALNEITVQRNNPYMLKTTVDVDGKNLSSYWSDGLIIATPTGSTAYSLSVGGPVVTPDNKNFIITPVAPHNLTIRPVVISENSLVKIRVFTRKGKALFSSDNFTAEIDSGSSITVKKSEKILKFIKLPHCDFFKTLHTKLNWGLDIRN